MKINEAVLSFEVRSNYHSGVYLQAIGADYHNFPMRVSVPVAPGAHSPDQALELHDEAGEAIPCTIRPMLCWPDGSVRVWELWLPVNLKQGQARQYSLHPIEKPDTAQIPANLALTAPLQFTLSALLSDGTRAQTELCFASTEDSQEHSLIHESEDSIVLQNEGKTLFKGALSRRIWNFYPGCDFSVRLINHMPGESAEVRGVRLEFDLPVNGDLRYGVRQLFHGEMPRPRFVESSAPFTVRADAGGVRVTDVDQLREDPAKYAIYDRPAITAVDPWLAISAGESTWLLVVPEARERFPKQWQIKDGRVIIDLHPEDAPPLEWRRGMALFQQFHLVRLNGVLDGAALDNEATAWLRPPLLHIDADQYRAAGWRIPFRYDRAQFPKTEHDIRKTFDFNWGTGTFNWGDDICESLTHRWASLTPEQRANSVWRNGEYDFVATAAKEYARTNRGALWRLCRNAAQHLMYTDFVAVSDDPWQEGGVPAHCSGHTTGSAYPSHIWAEGLTLYYQLSGDRYALAVSRRIGDFFLQYIDERFLIMSGTAREGGWTLIALAALYDLTREEKYLDGIRPIVDLYLSLTPDKFFPYDASFTVGIAIIGLDRVRVFERDAEIRQFMLNVLDWQMEHRCSPDGLFDYHFDAEADGTFYVQSKLPEALNIGYLLSGDDRYLRSAWRQFQVAQTGQLTVQNLGVYESGYAAGYHLSWMGCLQSFAERGWLQTMQYLEPPV